MRTLHLHLRREYFEAIRRGRKAREYRLVTPYWRKRLEGRAYDAIALYDGYPPAGDASRTLWRAWNGWRLQMITHPNFGDAPVQVFAIDVTQALEGRTDG